MTTLCKLYHSTMQDPNNSFTVFPRSESNITIYFKSVPIKCIQVNSSNIINFKLSYIFAKACECSRFLKDLITIMTNTFSFRFQFIIRCSEAAAPVQFYEHSISQISMTQFSGGIFHSICS